MRRRLVVTRKHLDDADTEQRKAFPAYDYEEDLQAAVEHAVRRMFAAAEAKLNETAK